MVIGGKATDTVEVYDCDGTNNFNCFNGTWKTSKVKFPFNEIKEVQNDKRWRYLYDYEVFIYEKMKKNSFGGMEKEYDLLLLFGGKISKNPTDSTDFLVSSKEVQNTSDNSEFSIRFEALLSPYRSSIFVYNGTSALNGEWFKLGRMSKPRSGFGVDIISWVFILQLLSTASFCIHHPHES